MSIHPTNSAAPAPSAAPFDDIIQTIMGTHDSHGYIASHPETILMGPQLLASQLEFQDISLIEGEWTLLPTKVYTQTFECGSLSFLPTTLSFAPYLVAKDTNTGVIFVDTSGEFTFTDTRHNKLSNDQQEIRFISEIKGNLQYALTQVFKAPHGVGITRPHDWLYKGRRPQIQFPDTRGVFKQIQVTLFNLPVAVLLVPIQEATTDT